MFLGVLGKIFSNTQASEKYSQFLFDEFIKSKNARAVLKIATEYEKNNKLSAAEIQDGKEKTVQKMASYLQSKDNITEKELAAYKFFVGCLSISDNERQQFLKICTDKLSTSISNNRSFPVAGPNKVSLPIMLKNGEQIQYRAKAIYLKKTKKTVGVNFAGPVASIRICKGVKYRIGSMNIQRKTVEGYDKSDEGIFYITNYRIGFLGQKQFSFDLKKLVSIQNGEAGILLYKQGRENPFMIALDNYDAPCEILSNLLNQ